MRRLLRAICGILWSLTAVAAQAQGFTEKHMQKPPSSSNKSLFTDSGYGKKWLGDFFPYQLPNANDLHAALGHMLGLYNAGILVLASMIALYSLIIFVVESAHHGKVGGLRNSPLYGQLRLIVAIGLLVPVSNGYNAAQIIIVNLAHAGSGLANAMWTEFTPMVAATDFSLPQSYNDATDTVLQKALISETCVAAAALDTTPSAGGPPSITLQAFYRDPANPGREIEGMETALSLKAQDGTADVMTAQSAIATEAQIKGLPVSRMRLHYNRSGYDDYCGAVDFPVPGTPTGIAVDSEEQAIYAEPFLQIRPLLAGYAASMASAVASKLVPATPAGGAGGSGAAAASATPAPAAPALPAGAVPAPAPASASASNTPAAPTTVELPQATMSPGAWGDMVRRMDRGMAEMADRASHDYIDRESESVDLQPASADWAEAGSLFFKLTKLSHDNLKLRTGRVTATLPDPEILPAEMRNDGVLAGCAPVLQNVFMADYHCRQDGQKTMLAIKVAYNLIHTVESQRGSSVVAAIDGMTAANRKEDTVSRRLFSDAGLDAVVAELARISSQKTVKDQHSAMFNLVNVGNILLTSTSGLFQQAALTGEGSGGVSQSLLLTLFGILLVAPALFLSIVLPLLPAVRFFLGIVAWLLTVFEGLVIFPLVILGSMRSEGEGLFAHGRQGYVLILQMMLRPVLMIFGMMAALIIFDALYEFATWAIWSGLLDLGASSGQLVSSGIQGVLELTGYLFLWTFLIYMAANLSFRAITLFPERALLWMGSIGGNGGSSTTTVIEAGPNAGALMQGGMAGGVLAAGPGMAQITQSFANAQAAARGPETRQPDKPIDHLPPVRDMEDDRGEKPGDHLPRPKGEKSSFPQDEP